MNAALRFTPPSGADAGPSGSIVSRLMPRPPQPKKQAPGLRPAPPGRVWVLRTGLPAAIPVDTGASNGRQTEISGELKSGMAVIVDYQEKPSERRQ